MIREAGLAGVSLRAAPSLVPPLSILSLASACVPLRTNRLCSPSH